jgi:hypothetical protein
MHDKNWPTHAGQIQVGDVDNWGDQRETASPDDARFLIPGRTIILQQNKQDMGAHRFTWMERNLMVAVMDMPEYDDRPPTVICWNNTCQKSCKWRALF